MIRIGKYNMMKLARRVDFGFYLTDPAADNPDAREILLPLRYVPDDVATGDTIEVFVYNDSEDRLIATTERPYATVGEFAFLEVSEVNDTGAFLDWGLMKDLLVPYSQQKIRMRRGGIYPVYVYLDDATKRVVASAKIEKFLGNVIPDYKKGDKVDCLVIEHAEIGYKVIVDNLHRGMIYENEIFRPVEIGESFRAYVKNVREDGKIDLTLSAPAKERIDVLSERIMKFIATNSGRKSISERSDPEEIKAMFSCSKKDFKKAIGKLYKEHRITIGKDGTITP